MFHVSAGNYIMYSRTSPLGGLGSGPGRNYDCGRGHEDVINRFIPKNWARFPEFNPTIREAK